jgi:hypothetical protein
VSQLFGPGHAALITCERVIGARIETRLLMSRHYRFPSRVADEIMSERERERDAEIYVYNCFTALFYTKRGSTAAASAALISSFRIGLGYLL